jgi:hypothetical protein
MTTKTVGITLGASLWATVILATVAPNPGYAEQPPPPCHPNPSAAQDEATVRNRGDVIALPDPLKDRLARLANRPHSILPLQVFNEADNPSQLFQYYLLETSVSAQRLHHSHPGVNDQVQLSVTGAIAGCPRSVRVRRAGTQTRAADRSHNPRPSSTSSTDISGLFVINNESGWYEVDDPRPHRGSRQRRATARRPCPVWHDYAGGCRGAGKDGHGPERAGCYLHH